jgi:hypothetical protein
MDVSSPVFLYPVGYTNRNEYHFLWQPGSNPRQEFEQAMQRFKKETRWKGTHDTKEYYWMHASRAIMRRPRGPEALEVVELLYGIQMSESIKRGLTSRSVLNDLHKLAWQSLSDYDDTATEMYSVSIKALRAVSQKIALSDSKVNLIEDYPALKRFLDG